MTTGFLQRVEPPRPAPPSGPRVPPTDNYAAAALRNELAEVESAPEGVRNQTLFNAACALAELANAGTLDEATVRDDLTDAGRRVGLEEFEISGTIDSGFKKVAGKARTVASPSLDRGHQNGEESASESYQSGGNNVWGEFPPVDGSEWMWDGEVDQAALWGIDNDILWADGEALMIAGGMGLGKSTLAGMLVRAQLGLREEVLGLPVAPVDKPILYLAMDRPRQIRRSMRRQFAEDERDLIKGRLFIRQGPPVTDLAVDPTLLARMALEIDAGVVYIDSLKDAVIGLSADEVAAAYNRARQYLLAKGVNILELHHNRKPGAMGGSTIGEVFGSTWLTSGAGSVIMLVGEPGDLVIRFHHRKMPADEVGPWRLHYDTDRGELAVVGTLDLWKLVNNAGPDGVTAKAAAEAMYEKNKPTEAECHKAARQLNKLVKDGSLTRIDGTRGGPGGSIPTVWFVAGVVANDGGTDLSYQPGLI